jgi:hydrogenase nickel incorporation protein HypB
MCVTCGCGIDGATTESVHEHVHADGTRHWHRHQLGRASAHEHPSPEALHGQDREVLPLEAQILGKNQLIAERNRGWLSGRGILALNLLSGPGAGKTTLLERTLTDLRDEIRISVVEGDQATSHDAQRVRAIGVPAVQINTGAGCHLEADMLERAIGMLNPAPNSLLLIENVGNLVCPALFDLGERAKVVLFSVTEGEDKPLKYPHIFSAARLVILSKVDLLPHLRFDAARAVANAREVNPGVQVIELSTQSGHGMSDWYGWLRSQMAACAGH